MTRYNDILILLVPGLGMVLVAGIAVICWYLVFGLQIRWFLVGAGLWSVSVILKLICARLINESVIGFMKENLSCPSLVVGGGLFIGIQSSLFEMGLTILAAIIWQQLGQDADRAIGIGIGAGVFEAFLLGIYSLIAGLATFTDASGSEKLREEIATLAPVTPFFWLLAPVERIIAILCHASSRALILLGATHGKPMMIFGGFLLFTLLDGVAGAAHLSGIIGAISMWWIELAIIPFALVSIIILRWCYVR